jgi:hypothetical protein
MNTRIILSIFTLVLVFSACKSDPYETFGQDFEITKDVLTAQQMDSYFDEIEIGDTAIVTFSTVIEDVCQKKGCWMEVALGEGYVARVTFLDYGFFVPLNAGGSDAVVYGKAFWKADTSAEKRHYAEDAGEEFDESELDEDEDYNPHVIALGVKIKK